MEEGLQSPRRESLFRSCKSPMKLVAHQEKEKAGKPPETKKNLIAIDLLEAFPEIKENFDIIKMVGEGTFSKVYLAKMKVDENRMFAFKYLVPTSSPKRIENELKCLQKLGGKCNVLGIKTSLRSNDHIVFMLPYFPHRRFNSTIDHFTANDVRYYMKNLFIALNHVHSHLIIHRDVKPNNFLYCKDKDSFALIDFGLAMPVPGTKKSFLKDYTSTVVNEKPTRKCAIPVKNPCKHKRSEICTICRNRPRQKAPRAGTPGFRSPEVLMKYPNQTTAVDMWSAGVILLCLLSKRYPFFKAKDDMDALAQIVTLFGTKRVQQMASSIGKLFDFNPPIDDVEPLKIVCEKLSKRSCSLHKKSHSSSSSSIKSMKRKQSDPADFSSPSKRTRTSETDSKRSDIHTSTGEKSAADQKDQVPVDKTKSGKPKKKIVCSCIPDSAYDLLERLLELRPDKRLSAEDALKHPFVA